MGKKIKYENAPIIEAIIDFHVIPDDTFSNNLYDVFFNKVCKEFSDRKSIQEFSTQINHSDIKSTVKNKSEIVGIRLESTEKDIILQIKKRGFTFSLLKNYNNWEIFSEKAKQLWEIYLKIFKPKKVIREAVRYINRIDIPLENNNVKIENYFHIYPNIGNFKTSDLLMRLQIEQDEHGGLAILTQSIARPEKPLHISFVLDIDAYDIKQFEIPKQKVSLWNRVTILRDQKNIIFENIITDKTRGLIK